MPQLGETVAEGTVTRWLHAVGDTVRAQEALLEVSTAKVDTEVRSPVSGTVLEILVFEDTTVAVGTVLALVGEQDNALVPGTPAHAPPTPINLPAPTGTKLAGVISAVPAVVDDAARHRHSPRVRRLAIEKGVALEPVIGTGPGGRVSPEDVLRAVTAADQPVAVLTDEPARVPEPMRGSAALREMQETVTRVTPTEGESDRREPMSPLRRVVAERVVSSLQTTAQLTTVVEVDLTRVVALRERMKDDLERRTGVRLTLTAFCAMAALEALRLHPLLNASIDQDGHTVVYHASQHLGVAVDTPCGLVVPVLRDAGDLNLLGLARQIAEVAQRARTGRAGPDELTGGTFTLINTGCRGALFDTPILNPPEVGILSTGAVVERPVVLRHDGDYAIAIRSMAYFALTYDHRLVDGAAAARYLATVKARLETGEFAAEL
jgi:pyruvate dehydrogenase E2 component (dihydrolipoamide acetyltransferase)